MASLVHLIENDNALLAWLMCIVDAAGYPVAGHRSVSEFLCHYSRAQTGCVVVDLATLDMCEEGLRSRFDRRGACPPMIFIADAGDVSIAVRAMQSGARDFLQKPINAEMLLSAIAGALEVPSTAEAVRALAKDRLYSLSPRELEVFAHVVRGEVGCSIAHQLSITVRTVKAQRATIRRKLGTRSVALWTRIAAQADFSILPITPPELCGRGGARWKRA